MRRGLILTIAGFVVLAAIAVAGWVRTPSPTASSPQPNCLDQAAVVNPAAWNSGYVTPAVYQQPVARPQRVVYRESSYTPTRRVVRKRPFSHSVAIVAGSAGAGAAIGALAGGKKGAGIGALSGGAAGLIYDRLTHRRVE